MSPSLVSRSAASGRHAAAEPDQPPPAEPWWRRLFPPRSADVRDGGHAIALRVVGALDDARAEQLDGWAARQRLRAGGVVVIRLDGCDFVNARGVGALVRLQGQVQLHTGRLVVLDAPRSLQIICRLVPDRLTLVPPVNTPAAAGAAAQVMSG